MVVVSLITTRAKEAVIADRQIVIDAQGVTVHVHIVANEYSTPDVHVKVGRDVAAVAKTDPRSVAAQILDAEREKSTRIKSRTLTQRSTHASLDSRDPFDGVALDGGLAGSAPAHESVKQHYCSPGSTMPQQNAPCDRSRLRSEARIERHEPHEY